MYEWATFHLDDKMSFEEACTVPIAIYMCTIGFCGMLKFKSGPWDVAHADEEGKRR